MQVGAHDRGDGLHTVGQFHVLLVVRVRIHADRHDGNHFCVVTRDGATRGALLGELVLQGLKGVVDLAGFALGVASSVRVFVDFDDDHEDGARALVARHPHAIGEAIGGGVTLAPALLGLGRAEAAALALVALVGREGRAVGVLDQRQQLLKDDRLPPLVGLDGRGGAVGRGLGLALRLARDAHAVAIVAQHPLRMNPLGPADRAVVV